jgi:hypothetical protein
MSEEYTVADYMIREQAATRHRAVADVVQWFGFSHLPTGLPRGVAERCAELASSILDVIPVDDPELTRGLSALVQVKDHFVRAAIVAQREAASSARGALDAQSLHDSPGEDL